MKKGIALFVTLSLIMIITILVSKSLQISQDSLKGITTVKKINQINFLIGNLKPILKQVIESMAIDTDESTIGIAFDMALPLEDKDIKLNLSFEPIDDKIDINYLLLDGNSSYLIEHLFNDYEVANLPAFYDLIHDTQDLDSEIRGGYDSEIILDDKSFENGRIYDYEHFSQILDRYSLLTDDINIHKIPWQKIFYFGEGKVKRPLYINFAHDRVKMFFDIGLDEEDKFEKNQDVIDTLSKEDIEKFNLKVYEKAGDTFLVLCKIEYSFATISGQIKLFYDLGKKEVVSIEEIL